MPQDTTGDRIAAVLERTEERLTRMEENRPPPDYGYADPRFQARLREEGWFRDFPVPVYQNDKRIFGERMSQDLIDRVAAMKNGKYLNGYVTIWRDGKNGIHIEYRNSTPDDRMQLPFKSFEDLVARVTAEQGTGA